MLVELLLLLVAFAAGTGIAELFGAENLGTALTFGQMAFAITLVAIIVGRRRAS